MTELILLDVFSYSCMNCLRSLNYIKKIDDRYKKIGLKTILVHPPEWEFEEYGDNILYATKKYKIKFPIIIDKNKKIIKRLNVNFWPTQILIRNGRILYKHIGEGNYKKLESAIIKNLDIRSRNIFKKEPKYSKYLTVYCGKRKNGKVLKKLTDKLKFGAIYINDNWTQKQEYIKSLKNKSSLKILTKGNKVNFVAESLTKKSINITIILNDKIYKKLIINRPKLYNLTILKDNKHNKLTIISQKNLAVYSFSFQ